MLENGLFIRANNLTIDDIRVNTHEEKQNTCTRKTDDPFSSFRDKQSFRAQSDSIQELFAAEITDYKTLSNYQNNQPQDILSFWRFNQRRLPILSRIVKQILVIQVSSSESERHFSAGGLIVNERRNRLDETSAESLTVLREAYLNDMRPKCHINDQPVQHLNEQLHESVSMANINDTEESSLF